jgi:hypothetical protein
VHASVHGESVDAVVVIIIIIIVIKSQPKLCGARRTLPIDFRA